MVASATPVVAMTARDLEAVPEAKRGELIRGEMRPVSPTNPEHFLVTGRIFGPLRTFVHDRGLGVVGSEGGFVLEVDPDTVLASDVAFVPHDRFPPMGQRTGYPRVVPDLVVEILSPSNTASEIDEKVRICLAAGVRLVWVVDPAAEVVTGYEPDGVARLRRPGEVLDGAPVLPGFRLPLDGLFA
jgi:Uma2 family endonuclease